MNKLLKAFLVLFLEIILILPGCLDLRLDRGSKSIDEYWADTDLGTTELESMLEDEVCYADRLSYLSCANALSQMAEKINLSLHTDGRLAPFTDADVESRLTEKRELSNWAEKYDRREILKSPTFLQLWKQLEKTVASKQKTSLIAAGMNGYLSVARDPHSYIIPLAFYEEVIAKSETRPNNLGFIARRTKENATIRKIIEGSPAYFSGLRKGDHILSINGQKVATMLPVRFAELLKVKDGDRLQIIFSRIEDGKKIEKTAEIIKSEFSFPSVEGKIIEKKKNLGLVTIHKFAKDTCLQTRQVIESLQQEAASGILLDLRDNPGGQVEEAACVLNLFVAKGQALFETRYNNPQSPSDKYVADRPSIYKGPLAVLINSGSASAAEIVAGALKDLGRATLVGERTFGKGTFQDGKIWGTHTKIAVFETEGMYYFPSGWTPQLVGIEPDLLVQFSELDEHREEELFFHPIMPKDLWKGPQALSWVQLMQCENNDLLWDDVTSETSDDVQMKKASEWLRCKNSKVGSSE
jgi:carboxyl-terminal processing protease